MSKGLKWAKQQSRVVDTKLFTCWIGPVMWTPVVVGRDTVLTGTSDTCSTEKEGDVSMKRSPDSSRQECAPGLLGRDRVSPAVRGWYKIQSLQLPVRTDTSRCSTQERLALPFGNSLVFACGN